MLGLQRIDREKQGIFGIVVYCYLIELTTTYRSAFPLESVTMALKL